MSVAYESIDDLSTGDFLTNHIVINSKYIFSSDGL